MGQAKPLRPTALVVEDDPLESSLACTVLEEAEFAVIECQSAEAALAVLQAKAAVAFVFTDVNLAGAIHGVELAAVIHRCCPRTKVVITSGNVGARASAIPTGTEFMQKPWLPLDLLVAAERVQGVEPSSGGKPDAPDV